MTRIVILISGRGSNMQAIVKACESGDLNAEVVAVISNNPDAKGLQFAASQGIDTLVVDHKQYESREAFDAALATELHRLQPDWIALAGFMRILGPTLVKQFEGSMLNIHPSLLPKYPGLDTHARALAGGETHHGATVHFVIPELDAGPVVAQSKVTVSKDDNVETLSSRVLATEHELYVRALQLCVNGNARYTADQ